MDFNALNSRVMSVNTRAYFEGMTVEQADGLHRMYGVNFEMNDGHLFRIRGINFAFNIGPEASRGIKIICNSGEEAL